MSERTQGTKPGDEYQDGHRLRQYNESGRSGFITGSRVFCDACAHQMGKDPQQAARHWARSDDNCEHPEHEFNTAVSGVEEPTEYEHYKDHPEVVGWTKDNFGPGKDTTLCPSCAEDRRSAGHQMEPYYPLTTGKLMPEDSCDDCGHDLQLGRKEASMRRRAISDAEMRRLTDLPPLDLSLNQAGSCSNCGARLGPGETGVCPACEQAGGGRKTRHRQRQKLVQQKRGGLMQRTAMLDVLDHIWKASARPIDPDAAQRKYRTYKGRSGHVPIANNTWMHKDDQGQTFVRHHDTNIMGFRDNGDITVDTGGWDSSTTRSRINAFLPSNMKLMRNPSKAAGAPERVIAHNPSGGSIYPEHHWGQEGWSRETEPTRGKYGLHTDTVLHPYEDGFTINHHSGEVHDNAVEHSGTTAAPPQARGFNPEHPQGVPRSRPSRNYYDTGTDYSGANGLYFRGEPFGQQHPYEPPTPMHEQQSTHEEISRQLEQENRRPAGADSWGDSAGMGFSHHDMPGEGESFDDWLDRTTKPATNVPCPSCKGRGDVRATGPVPPGVNPWEHREPCKNCGGEGLVRNARITRHGGLASLETLTRRYIAGLQVLAYGEVKAPVNVDTLREDACPVCGENDAFDGDQCQVCGFVTPPKMFRDPDLDAAKLLDLRADPASGDPNDQNPNVGANLPPVDESEVDEDGDVAPGAEGEEADEPTDEEGEDGVVEGEVRGLGDVGEPVDEDEVDEDGDVVGGPEDPEAATQHINQGGEPFTKGPNAPEPESPAEPGEQVDGLEEETEDEEGGGLPGTPGDSVADLFCPACGFEAGAASPTSTPGNAAAPADAGDGMLEGDICPNCQKATLMTPGEIEQAEQMQPGAMAR
jgi:hypothetical protein